MRPWRYRQQTWCRLLTAYCIIITYTALSLSLCRPDIFPEFERLETPLPKPLPGDPEVPDEEEEEEEEKKKKGPGEDPDEEGEEEQDPDKPAPSEE
jgi:hypothetical protein